MVERKQRPLTGYKRAPRIAIIGSGFSGLAMGIALKRAGLDSFTIFEKDRSLGGTWRENTYPGACCDTKAFAYCYSFEQKTDWSQKWAPAHEILDYLRHCARKYRLERHLRLGTAVASASFDARSGAWTLATDSGDHYACDVLIPAVGQLHRPAVPDIPGMSSFRGRQFHSAEWDHDCPLAGRRVGVIGNAASAIQFIPEVARQAAELYVFQRSANWILPRGNRPYSAGEQRMLARSALLARLYRAWIWAYYELYVYLVIRGVPGCRALAQHLARRYMRREITDPALREKLVPDYPMGAKRILVSDDYYAALTRPNVQLVTQRIERVTPSGVYTTDGSEYPLDALIFGTGFKTTEFLAPMTIRGPGGEVLEDRWRAGAEAYLGMTVPGFPNLFMMYGPNTNLGHYSIVFMAECQARYIAQCIELMARNDSRSIEVRAEVCAAFNTRMQQRLQRSVWAQLEHSWYMRDGRITNNWAGSTSRYWWCTRRVRRRDFKLEPRVQPHADVGDLSRRPAG